MTNSDGLATLALTGGKVLTVNECDEVAEAVAIRGDRIVAVGSDAAISAYIGPDTTRIDLAGRTVVPGLIDGHAHMDREGLKSVLPSLAGVGSIDDILQRIAAEVGKAEPGDWIVMNPIGEPPEFGGYPEALAEGRYPTRTELDSVSPDNPVFIRPIWGYWRKTFPVVSIANSAALERAGIGRETTALVPSVQIDRDPLTGKPTGVFREWNKMPVVEFALMGCAPSFDVTTRTNALFESMRVYNSLGTTSVVEGHGVAADVLAAYQALAGQGRHTVRATLSFSPAWDGVSGADVTQLIASWGRWLAGTGLGDDWLRVQGIYSEADDSRERALRAAGSPQTGWAGFNFDASLPREKLKPLLVECARYGIRVTGILPHMLDLFREVDAEVPISGQRWVFGHVTSLSADDIAAIRDLGLVITTHTSSFLYKGGLGLLDSVGAERENEIVPLRALVEAGVPVSFGSDNVPPSLFHSFWHAVARRERSTGRVIGPQQALTRAQALRCMTMGGAFLALEERNKGSLEPGKLADLAVLTCDPLTCPEDDLRHIRADLTVVGGKVVHASAPNSGAAGVGISSKPGAVVGV